jgi:hypothetical protein
VPTPSLDELPVAGPRRVDLCLTLAAALGLSLSGCHARAGADASGLAGSSRTIAFVTRMISRGTTPARASGTVVERARSAEQSWYFASLPAGEGAPTFEPLP